MVTHDMGCGQTSGLIITGGSREEQSNTFADELLPLGAAKVHARRRGIASQEISRWVVQLTFVG